MSGSSGMSSISASERPRPNKNQNIQVTVRLRPLNARERDIKSIGVVEVSGTKEIVVRQPALDNRLSKKFTFDKAFGPNSKQVDVYHEVVSPLIEEVLAGYNCTVFAYGQTGTGKTHTMVGESSGDSEIPWQNDPMAGIIPRSLSQLFDELRLTNSEYTVRVSYLELYNEELFDLLSSSEDNSKLRIYEDATKKGANIVSGLEELTVYNKNEVYKIMAKGQEKRKIASTLMNAQSSRSHTVFTITVHMKENNPDGEELMKIGKLNLVDLAGSENISKAGTDNPSRRERARESVNINQSLLTLGRVITALVERHPHIPYRESKLTRLLQESLGGRTKTSIIATISPGHRDVEETLSTLEYAHRARNIQNKPEINQKMTKKAVLKEYSEEIDRLKRDLHASREKSGVYLANETYTEMILRIEEQERDIQERILLIKAMKEEKDRFEGLFNELSINLRDTENKLNVTNKTLQDTKQVLNVRNKELKQTKLEVEEQEHLVSVMTNTESKLTDQAANLLKVAEITTKDLDSLHNTLDKKRNLETSNLCVTRSFGTESQSHRNQMKDYLDKFSQCTIESFSSFHRTIDAHLNNYENMQSDSKQTISEMFCRINDTLATIASLRINSINEANQTVANEFSGLKEINEQHYSSFCKQMGDLVVLISKLDKAREKDRHAHEDMKLFIEQWKNTSIAKIINLRRMGNELCNEVNNHMKAICFQHESMCTKNNEEVEIITSLTEKYDQEIVTGVNEVKSLVKCLNKKTLETLEALEALEEKKALKSTELMALKQNYFVSSGIRNENFSKAIVQNNDTITSKMQEIDNMVNVFYEKNKLFIEDIFAKLENSQESTISATLIDGDIKKSVSEVSDICKDNRTENLNIMKNVGNIIKNKFKEKIDEHYEQYSTSLNGLNENAHKALQPIENTLENINKQCTYQQEEHKNFENSVCNFKQEIEEALSSYDNVESKFLNENYKLYSPTGKTPTRREYPYLSHFASTSPHERILARFRKARDNTKVINTSSPIQIDDSTILDEILEITPFKCPSSVDFNSGSHSLDGSNLKDNSLLNIIYKSPSENDISKFKKESKENLSVSASEKRNTSLKLKTPNKVLRNKND